MQVRIGVVAILLAVLAAGSGASLPVPAAAVAKPAAPHLTGELVVFADQSLQAAMGQLDQSFERAHPALQIIPSFGTSQTLGREIQHGVDADILVTTDPVTLNRITRGGVAGAPHLIALNTMEIVVPAGNPKAIEGLKDLMRPGVRSLACRVTQPCGRYAVLTFARAGLALPAAATESDGSAIIDRVAHGAVDAGLVFTTQVEAADGSVQGVEIPAEYNVGVRYVVVLMLQSEHDRAAAAFYQFLASSDAQNILTRYGFQLP